MPTLRLCGERLCNKQPPTVVAGGCGLLGLADNRWPGCAPGVFARFHICEVPHSRRFTRELLFVGATSHGIGFTWKLLHVGATSHGIGFTWERLFPTVASSARHCSLFLSFCPLSAQTKAAVNGGRSGKGNNKRAQHIQWVMHAKVYSRPGRRKAQQQDRHA